MSSAVHFAFVARLPDVEATIEYCDADGRHTVRRVAFCLLAGERKPEGDTLMYASAWCYLRQARRTFHVDRIATLIPVGAPEPVASPEVWFREQARGQVRHAPPPRRLPPQTPREELFVLYSGLEFDALVQVCSYDRTASQCWFKDFHFEVDEIATLASGDIRVICGTDLMTDSRLAIHIDSITRITCPRTGEVAGARRQWLRDMADASLRAGHGYKLFEPARTPEAAMALADEIRRTAGSFLWPLEPGEAD